MTRLWRNLPWRLRVAALLFAAAMVALVDLLAPLALSRAEALGGDLAWRLGASSRAERRLVVVDIDEASLRELGPWPWPRARLAELSQRLTQAGAVVQALDINFSDAREGDAALAQAWAEAPVVAAQIFSLDPAVTPRIGELAGALQAEGCPAFAPRSHGHYGTAGALLQAHPAVGHITPRVEGDGVVRKVPAVICDQGRAYPSLPLAAMWRAAQPEAQGMAGVQAPGAGPDWQWHSRADQGFAAGLLAPVAWLSSASLPGLMVPVDEHGDMRVPYRTDRKALASVSAAEVMRGTADLPLLKGAVVLIGATAFGIGDTVATPQAAVASGLEVHAQVLAGLLDHRLPYQPARWAWAQGLGMLAVAGLLLWVAVRQPGTPVRRLPLLGLALAVACWAGAAAALIRGDLWLPWTSVALFAIFGSVALATAEHALTRLQRERLSAHLGAYLPTQVAERLAATEPTGRLQVEQREVSVLVADIRNFSAFAAHRPAEETAALLHAFCCIAVEVVERHGGVVENVVGDSVLAVWNADPDRADHPERAMSAARELLHATRPLLVSNQPLPEGGPVQPLALGVGLESGSAIVGSFGPARRRAHAALGEPVSVATRIQQMTTDLSVPILVGPRLAASLPADNTESLGEYLLEGLGRPYRLFAPTAWADLVPVDPHWAHAASGTDRSGESSGWSRWVDATSSRTASSGPLVSRAPKVLRDA